ITMTPLLHKLTRMFRRPRLATSALVAIVVFLVLLTIVPTARAMLIAFDVGAALFIALITVVMFRATPQTMRQRAQVQDEGKWTVLFMSLGIAGVVLGALSNELHAARDKSLGDIVLASSSIFLSWLFVAIMFSQQYAHSFYMKASQLEFPGTAQPDYFDFMYFAMVLSMCCQTSDVVVSSSSMRRLVMLHSVVSFFFNVIIIAITVNVVAGVL
ncbi:MAG: hypothetical protein RIS34_635, partial [Pseudomonadota bacterium]